MGTRTWMVVLVLALTAGWFARGALSDEDEAPGPDMEKLMKELATPGEQHAWLARATGEWNVEATWHEMDGSVTHTKGTAAFKMILGGRWQFQMFKGTYRDEPFEGVGITGYDKGNQVFANYWFDTMSTGTAPATGQLSDDGKTLTLSGVWEIPGMSMPYKYVTTWTSDDAFTFHMIMDVDGHEMAIGVMKYTRKR